MNDELSQIQAVLDETGVYVHPSVAGSFPPDLLDQIEANVAASPTSVYVVVRPLAYDGDYGGRISDLLSRLHDASGNDGLYLGVSDLSQSWALEARSWGNDPIDEYDVTAIASASGDDVPQQLVEVTASVAHGTVQEDAAAAQKELDSTRTSTGSDSSGGGDGAAASAVAGISVVVALVVYAFVHWRRRQSVERPFELPESVLDRVRDARDEDLWRQAGRDVQRLGEALDDEEIRPADSQDSWQQALDHYALARRVLGDRGRDTVDLLDVVGAIVLAQRGQAALTAARDGSAYTPERLCFLNPLHGGAETEARVAGQGGAVPLCADCRGDLGAKRRPDILDVVRGGKPVHYFDSGAEPWASSGYGALRTDLVTELQRRT